MQILVTGGLGAVGTYLVKELRRRDHDVWINDLCHHHDPKYLRGDVGDYRQLERVVIHKKFQLVYHMAAEFGRWNGEDFYETMWRSNVVGTKNLLRLQEKHKFRQVFFSSSEVYGDYEGVMLEDVMDKVEIRQMNDYAISKWVGEQQVLNSTGMHGTESVRVRLFNTYGPGEPPSPYRSVICRFVYAALTEQPYTVYLNHTRTSTYVTDTCNTLANISDHFKPGEVYNISGTDYHDIKSVSDLILRIAGKTDKLVTYKDGEPFTTKHKKVEVTKALRDLEHAPKIGLEQGIVETVKWMREYIAANG
jgi:dTDP-glucose 4,6-dehydratase